MYVGMFACLLEATAAYVIETLLYKYENNSFLLFAKVNRL